MRGFWYPQHEEKCLFVAILLVLILILALILDVVLLILIFVLVLILVLMILILVVILVIHSICHFLPNEFLWIPGEGIHNVLRVCGYKEGYAGSIPQINDNILIIIPNTVSD